MHLFFSVGEPSGDQHAAHLMRALRAQRGDCQFSGFGGPLMAAEGSHELFRLADLAVMGIIGIAPLLGTFFRLLKQADQFLAEHRPDAVVLIDYPGFNWWIARKARKYGIPVYYYCPPQIWAWGGWRIHKMRRLVDRVLSVLPFEADWYQKQGMKVEYVGHPFFDEACERQLQPVSEEPQAFHYLGASRLVGILPGSRNQEVRRNVPAMIEVVRRLSARHPDLRFAAACYQESHRQLFQQLLVEQQATQLPITLLVGQTSEIVAWSECVLMVSGSVSLELVMRGTPAVVTYRAGVIMSLLVQWLVRCPFASLPNLMANRELFPEVLYSVGAARAIERMTELLETWLSDPSALQAVRNDLLALREQVGQTGGLKRAATALVRGTPIRARAA